MAALQLTAAEEEAAMKLGSSELKYLLMNAGVSGSTQAKFFHVHITTMELFAMIAEKDTELKSILKTEMGLDPDSSLAARVEVAKVVVAHNKAKVRFTEASKYEGEMSARQMPKPLARPEYLAMKEAWEKKWWKLEEVDTPSRQFVEKRAEELENGEMRAEQLTTVLNREQDEDEDYLTPIFDTKGQMKVKKSTGTVEAPANPEELRRRIALSFTALMFLALRHTNREFLQSVTPQLAHRYCEYLLGEHVWCMVAKDASGQTISAPHFALVLSYEMAIRKKAYRWMADGEGSFAECLEKAWKDSTVKERNFTTPMAMSAASGTHVEVVYGSPMKEKDQAGRGNKGTGKGKGKGRGKASKVKGSGKRDKGKKGGSAGSKCASHTPDGEAICYGYNNEKVRCGKKCWFLHVCGSCFGKHPMYQCPGNKTKPETQGAGVSTA
jgi:hypothetical protein